MAGLPLELELELELAGLGVTLDIMSPWVYNLPRPAVFGLLHLLTEIHGAQS